MVSIDATEAGSFRAIVSGSQRVDIERLGYLKGLYRPKSRP
jgi:hypothetical protein